VEAVQPIQILKRELTRTKEPEPDLTPPRGERKPATLDIAMIGAASFHWNLKDKSNTLFTATIYKIDYIIDKKLQAKYNESDDRVE
jgi:hypothetical protein